MARKGYQLVAESVRACGADTFFYLIGGPMTPAMEECVALGMRGIDVRDERAAAFATIAYSRVCRRPGIVMSCSGPGTTNTITGLSHALADGAPVVALGGSSPMYQRGMGAFQETDQVSLLRPATKWSHQVQSIDRIPDTVMAAFQTAQTGRPGPVYLDFPADILYGDTKMSSDEVRSRARQPASARALGDPQLVAEAVGFLRGATRPIVIAGSGVLWAEAWDELKEFVETSGIPLFTTPMARGIVPEDHPLCLTAARSAAFREADCMLIVGTRANYVVNWLQGPVINPDSRLIELNVNPEDLSRNRVADVAILADAKLGLRQLTAAVRGQVEPAQYSEWVEQLRRKHSTGRARTLNADGLDASPIHPLRLCIDLDQVLPKDGILIVDGHEILGFSRRGITAHVPGHSINPGVYGTMGVGVPFGIGAKVALPDAPVVVLTGDGAFGYHAMEVDTAVRHRLGIVIVISNNGGWTGKRGKPGRDLGFVDYHRLADAFGVWGRKVTEPDAIKPALVEAIEFAEREHKPALMNVIVAPEQAEGRAFVNYQPA